MNPIRSFRLLSFKFRTAVCSLLILVSAGAPSWIFGQETPPNIVFILADDMGWADLPVYGNQFNEAPNLSRLAEEGMRFTNAYAAAPVCSPSRAGILSGQYPARVGVIDFIRGHWRPYEKVRVPTNRTQYLPPEIYTIGEVLRDAGYATGYFGKWHLSDEVRNEAKHPLGQGFDKANTGQGFYHTRFTPPRQEGETKRFSERITDFGIDFIEKNRDKPFFLMLSHYDVHVQLDADQELIDKYLHKDKVEGYPCNAIYAAMVEHIDRSVGRIVDELEKKGLSERTLVVFFSDNGGLVTRYDNKPLLAQSKLHIYKESNPLRYIASSNAPLRGEKGTVYEGGIREPLLVKWPGKIKAGSVSDALVCGIDFYPTFLELARAAKKQTQPMDGESIVPVLLSGEQQPARAIYWHYPVYHHGVPAGAVRKGNWKLIENQVSGAVSLYNLEVDISESTDLSSLYPGKKEELYNLLKKWQKNIGVRFPRANPDFNENRRFEWGVHPDKNR